MKLLIVRHGPAGDKKKWARSGEPDSRRPLTAAGRRKLKLAAKGIASVFPGPAALFDSGLKRSVETADLLSQTLKITTRTTIKQLAPEVPIAAIVAKLAVLSDRGDAVLIGHEPQLSSLISDLATGGDALKLELKKGAACLLDITGPPRSGSAKILWVLAPAQLRRLAH